MLSTRGYLEGEKKLLVEAYHCESNTLRLEVHMNSLVRSWQAYSGVGTLCSCYVADREVRLCRMCGLSAIVGELEIFVRRGWFVLVQLSASKSSTPESEAG